MKAREGVMANAELGDDLVRIRFLFPQKSTQFFSEKLF
jgi:hypothetical protein